MMPDFSYEKKLWKKGFRLVVGADEVGRGAFAGPVVASAVALAPQTTNNIRQTTKDEVRIDDSKKLTPRKRERAEKWIKENALCWGVGEASVGVINRLGMGKATRMAFRKAVAECNVKLEVRSGKLDKEVRSEKSHFTPQSEAIPASHFPRHTSFLLIDAFYLPYTRGLRRKHQLAIVNGDEKSVSIAAASILAKVHRDKLMRRLGKKHPQYGWGRNKGYGTREHQKAILRYGLTRLHRKQFVSGLSEDRG